jgi:glucose/arabinose dehydrogenase
VRPVVLALLLVALLVAPPAGAAVDWPQPVLVPLVSSGLSSPVHLTHAGDGSGRLFVVEQAGVIRIIRNGVVEPTPFLDISGRVLGGGEQGLLSVAFPPGYGGKGYFYVYYTRRGAPGDTTPPNVVARFGLVGADRADPDSEVTVLEMDDPYTNHNGGIMQFGPDGYLYVGTGDGGSGGDPENRAQDLTSPLGKILRLDVESAAPAGTYAIPASNPIPAGGGRRREIWAYGLRNPWRLGFDRQTGDLYIGDVGQGAREEVNFQPAGSAGGENYGWRLMEGSLCFNPSSNCNPGGLTLPVVDYGRSLGSTVTGGFVYRGTTYPRMRGVYFYADFGSGRLWGLTRDGGVWTNRELLDTSRSFSSFGEDEAGELYLVDYAGAVPGAGAVIRVTDALYRQRMPLVPRGVPPS